jgi:hypothetical protein
LGRSDGNLLDWSPVSRGKDLNGLHHRIIQI